MYRSLNDRGAIRRKLQKKNEGGIDLNWGRINRNYNIQKLILNVSVFAVQLFNQRSIVNEERMKDKHRQMRLEIKGLKRF